LRPCRCSTAGLKLAGGANRGVQDFHPGARRRGGFDRHVDATRAAGGFRAMAQAWWIRQS